MTNVPARKLPERALPFISFLTCSQVGTSPLHCPSEHLRVWGLISRETLLGMIMHSVFRSINLDLKIPTMNHGNDHEQCFPKYQIKSEVPKHTSVPWVRADSVPLSKCRPPSPPQPRRNTSLSLSPPQPRNTFKPCLYQRWSWLLHYRNFHPKIVTSVKKNYILRNRIGNININNNNNIILSLHYISSPPL